MMILYRLTTITLQRKIKDGRIKEERTRIRSKVERKRMEFFFEFMWNVDISESTTLILPNLASLTSMSQKNVYRWMAAVIPPFSKSNQSSQLCLNPVSTLSQPCLNSVSTLSQPCLNPVSTLSEQSPLYLHPKWINP